LFVIDKENILESPVSTLQNNCKELDNYYSSKKLGSYVENGRTIFRLFAPSAVQVRLCVFEKPEDKIHKEYFMLMDDDGV